MQQVHERELVVLRLLDAEPARVFKAFTTPETLKKWLGPRGSKLGGCVLDPRVGGRFRFELEFEGGMSFVLAGEYREFEPARRLAFSWGLEGEDDDSEVAISFEADDGRTRLRLEHRGLAADEIAQNEGGWNEFFDRLTVALA
ncbi:MAG: SRPBCC domain-containing protein [Chloroflexi bacterium]|nr:SRPBCC domain-containing protein [Chloroflexota bacterium]